MIQKYIIRLSDKTEIRLDEDELPLVIQGIQAGKPVKVRQGIFNPSFYVAVVLDRERIKEYLEKNPTHNFGEPVEVVPIENLPDIFSELKQLN